MAKLGSAKNPIVVRVGTEERSEQIMETCAAHGWQCIVGMEPDLPEDVSDLERMLSPLLPVVKEEKAGRNDPCPCGSGKKLKKCCGRELGKVSLFGTHPRPSADGRPLRWRGFSGERGIEVDLNRPVNRRGELAQAAHQIE
jgi:SWIM/SEC-C metal-binding protein